MGRVKIARPPSAAAAGSPSSASDRPRSLNQPGRIDVGLDIAGRRCALTAMPRRDHSRARLLGQHGRRGLGRIIGRQPRQHRVKLAIEAMLMMRAWPAVRGPIGQHQLARRPGRRRTSPRTLTSKVRSQSSMDRSRAMPSPPTPALLTRMDIGPSPASISSKGRGDGRGRPRHPDAGPWRGRLPPRSHRPGPRPSRAVRAVTATAAPARASTRAKCAPSPPDAPVITAV